MIVCIDSDTFLNHFILEQSPKTILGATYIVASNNIRFGTKYSNQIKALFLPTEYAIIAMNDEKSIKASSNSEYVKRYFSELEEDIRSIAIIIKMSLMLDALVIILATSREVKAYNHIKLFRIFVKEKFGYDIPMYKPGMNLNKLSIPKKNDMVELCEDIIKKDKKKEKKILMKSENGKKEYLSRFSKKELKKILKKNGLYRSAMDESEMIDVINMILL